MIDDRQSFHCFLRLSALGNVDLGSTLHEINNKGLKFAESKKRPYHKLSTTFPRKAIIVLMKCEVNC